MFKDEEWVLFFQLSDLHNNQIIYITYFHYTDFFVWNIKVVHDGLKYFFCCIFCLAELCCDFQYVVYCSHASIFWVTRAIIFQTALYHFLYFRYMLITFDTLVSDCIDSLDRVRVFLVTS